ncbi:MAG: hypothetical protein J0G30_04605 [Actinomycetales bacterium]|nr:hypothetical protein [Actinomycetales bacterium]
MRTPSLLRRLARTRDEGFALPTVVGIAAVLLLVVATSLAVTTSGLKKSVTDEDWNGALAAAYAGIEEYQSRLSDDSTYVRYGNPSAAFSVSSSSLTLPTGANVNPAFGITAGGTWASVPGSTTGASFRYEIDNSRYATTGTLRIRSTGRVGDATRTIVADLRQSGFLDFLYYTQYEVIDPSISGNSSCNKHWYDPGSTRPSSCDIQFGTFDVLNGAVHSNDRLVVCGATFRGKVTSANPKTPIAYVPSGCSAATYEVGTGVSYSKPIDPPPTNSEMKKETRSDLPADVPRPGCMYTGPTQITFLSNGKMNVISPFTKVTQPNGSGGGLTPAMCGSISDLKSSSGATIDTIPQNLVYVQNVPTSSSDPNYWPTSGSSSKQWPSGFSCSNKGSSSEGWSFGSARYPMSGESTPNTSSSSTPAYGCRNGDAYVSGSLKGQITVATENYIYAVDDIVYADDSAVLGLVGNNAVWIWNPVGQSCSWYSCSTVNLLSEDGGGREIDAAIMSVAHTVMVQNYNVGSARGTLKIVGALAQNYRGTVATSSGGGVATGFSKDYNYDPRFKYTAPPKFLTPVSTSYGITQFANVPAAFAADGSPS